MKLNKILLKGAFALSALLAIGTFTQVDLNAAGYRALPITGTRDINLTFNADDTISGVPYSGNLRYRACSNCKGNPSGEWAPLRTTDNHEITNAVQSGTFYIKGWVLPDREGEHEVCVQIMDNAIHGQSNNVGNISNQQCNTVFYDKSAPIITDIVLNEGNKFINHGSVPGKFKITDNRAGIEKITYNDGFGGTREIPAEHIVCKKSTNPVEGDGSVSCSVETTFELNSDTAYNDLVLRACDKVGNCKDYGPTRIYFDKVVPDIQLIIPESGSGESVNTNEAVIEYHIKDDIQDPWIYPSGIQKVVLSNNGYNKVTILVNSDLTKDMATTLDGMIRDYAMSACPGVVKLEVWDRAGNYGYEDRMVESCSNFLIENVTMNNVINPNKYNASNPFPSTDYMPAGEMIPLPQALAGANINFTITYKWDGDAVNKMYGKYIITVRNEDGSYNKSFTQEIKENEFVVAGTDTYTTTHEVKLPTDAPKSVTGNNTYVHIEVQATVETVEDDVVKTGHDTFPDVGNGIIATIVGSIEDYLWFGETN